MVDFAAVLQPGIVAPDDQFGNDRGLVVGRGTTAYYDPPNMPRPLARAPAGQIGLSKGEGPFGQLLGLRDGNGNQTGWGLITATFTSEINRRATRPPLQNFDAVREDDQQGGLALGPGNEWFEKVIAFPSRLDLGNVLSTQVRTIEIMNTYRRPFLVVDWLNFTNNVGPGVDVTNLPALPTTIGKFDSFVADVQISTAGPPTISGTLDFGFGAPVSPNLIAIPITGNRITIFQYKPQAPIKETLQFKTDILRNNDGSEQRVRVREAPRQLIDYTVRVDDEISRDSINAVLFDWQARVFGVPIWWEQRPLDADIAINDTTIAVNTADADYRVDSLVMVYTNDQKFEVLEVDTINPSSIITRTPFTIAFDAIGSVVLPVRTALTKPQLSNARFAIGPADYRMEFEVLDNIDLADLGSFDTYQGVGQSVAKPALYEFNFMGGNTIGEGNRRKVIRLDVESGPPLQFSPWAKGKPLYQFGFEAKSFADVYRWRRLAHYLHGSQLSFYVPTGRTDFKILTDPIGVGATFFDCVNFGFTNFVQQVTPRSDIRFLLKDGTFTEHQLISSVEQSSTVERISFTPGLPFEISLADLERCEILTLCRIDGDKVTLDHRRPGETRIAFNLIGVPV